MRDYLHDRYAKDLELFSRDEKQKEWLFQLLEENIDVSSLSGETILDISANNGSYTLAFAEFIDQGMHKLNSEGQILSPVQLEINDIAYGNDEPTPLKSGVEKNIYDFQKNSHGNITINKPRSLNAFAISTEDLEGQRPAVIIDNAGALWHAVSTRDVYSTYGSPHGAVKALLGNYYNLLNKHGSVVLDGDAEREVGYPTTSTMGKFKELFSSEKEFTHFLSECGFVLTEVKGWATAITILDKVSKRLDRS